MKILIIEDERELVKSMAQYLRQESYVCEVAYTAQEANEKILLFEYDCILLDINLPDIDGYEVARRIRSSDRKHSLTYVPIIAVTANALKGDAEKALSAGCDVYMSKPINIRELWARVEAFVPSPNTK